MTATQILMLIVGLLAVLGGACFTCRDRVRSRAPRPPGHERRRRPRERRTRPARRAHQ